jgi:hypothetical protein
MAFGRRSGFSRVFLQLAYGCTDLFLEIGRVGDRYAANSVGFEVFPDQIAIWRVGRQIKQPQSTVQALDKSSGLLSNVRRSAIDDQESRVLGTGD